MSKVTPVSKVTPIYGMSDAGPAERFSKWGAQWRNEPNYLGGGGRTIFARERSDQARGSVATEGQGLI